MGLIATKPIYTITALKREKEKSSPFFRRRPPTGSPRRARGVTSVVTMSASPANPFLPAGDEEGRDLISLLPDCVLTTIVSLLPLRDAARTTALSRRWRRIWPSAPLRLIDFPSPLSAKTISQILASHHDGPVQFHLILLRPSPAHLSSWLHTLSAKHLQELVLQPPSNEPLLLPPSIFECRSIRSAEFTNCRLSDPEDAAAADAISFPLLAELSLRLFHASTAALHGLLARCPTLASLSLDRVFGCPILHVRSGTLRSLTVSVSLARLRMLEGGVELERLVVEDAPVLERLLAHDINWGPSISVEHALRLQMLGYLGVGIPELQLGSTLFRSMSAVRLAAQFRCLRTLALEMEHPQAKPVADFLYCFPCLETLYVTSNMVSPRSMGIVKFSNVHDPVECLNNHLRTVVLKGYRGAKHEAVLAMYLIRNARVLEVMNFLCDSDCNPRWLEVQKRRLRLEGRASLGARFVFQKFSSTYSRLVKRAANISIVDPFDIV